MLHEDQHIHDLGPSDTHQLEPIVCQLANGHNIKIVAAEWSRWRTYEEWVSSSYPEPYFAIRIYCTQDTIPKRLSWVEEYCEDSDFFHHDFESLWQWLAKVCTGREVFAFDELDEFLDCVSETIIQTSTMEPDAVEYFARISEITDLEAFDKVDDSIFNDQNQ